MNFTGNLIFLLQQGSAHMWNLRKNLRKPPQKPTHLKIWIFFQTSGVKEENIYDWASARMKLHATECWFDITNCTTNNKHVQKLICFLKYHRQIILLKLNKSPDLIFLDKPDYYRKVNALRGWLKQIRYFWIGFPKQTKNAKMFILR